jgi:hypothetical protein
MYGAELRKIDKELDKRADDPQAAFRQFGACPQIIKYAHLTTDTNSIKARNQEAGAGHPARSADRISGHLRGLFPRGTVEHRCDHQQSARLRSVLHLRREATKLLAAISFRHSEMNPASTRIVDSRVAYFNVTKYCVSV